MSNSSSKGFEVFDFKQEDDTPEFSSAKSPNRFKFSSPLNKKHNLFGKATKGTHFEINEMGTLPFVEDDGKGSDLHGDNGILDTAVHMEEDSGSMKMCGLDGVSLFNSSSRNCHPQSVPDSLKTGSFSARLGIGNSSPKVSPGHSPLLCSPSGCPSSTESVDTSSDVDDSISESSPSTSFDVPGDEVPLGRHDSPSGHGIGDPEMGEGDIAVRPDFVVCQGRCYTNSALFFSSSCLRLKDIHMYGSEGTLSVQWEVDDIVEIGSEWSKRHEFARVRLSLISKDASAAQDGTSGIEHLTFGVFDPDWPDKQEKIMSLDIRYKAIWNMAFRTDAVNGAALPGQNRFVFPWRSFNEPFDEFVYPKGDIDAVSISKRDVDLLQPDTFVNDTIIDFYIKYLKNELEPEKRQRFHFFNSFFFRKLIDLDKDSPSSFEGRAAFQRVRKWTRKVNLFEKDYVFIPVNYNYHWSLIVICHPGEISMFPDEDRENLHKVPCILHMDSIRGTHCGLKEFIQSYLWELWKERQKDACEDTSTKFSNLRFVSLELPQQQNCFDCGLFLLHYVEHFLDEAPRNFSPFKITKFSNFLNEKWFSPGEPSLKRGYIQKLILKILEGENSAAASSDKPCPSNCRTSNNGAETDVVLVAQRCSPSKSFHEPVINPQADQGITNDIATDAMLVAQGCSPSKNEPLPNPKADRGIEITLLPTTSAGASGMVLRELFEDGADAAEVFPVQYEQVFDRTLSFSEFGGALPSTTEQVEEGGDMFPSNRSDYSGMKFEAGDYPYSTFRDLEGERSQNTGHGEEDGDEDGIASTQTSVRASEESLEVEVKDSNEVEADVGKEENMMDQPSCLPTEKVVDYTAENLVRTPGDLPTVADSQSPEQMNDGDSFGEICLLSGGNGQKASPGTETDGGMQKMKRIGDDLEEDDMDLQPSKRLRLEPAI